MNSNEQLNLFDDNNEINLKHHNLEIEYIKDFFSKEESYDFFEILTKNIEWKQDFGLRAKSSRKMHGCIIN